MKDIKLEILESLKDSYHDWRSELFLVGNKIAASNGVILIAFDNFGINAEDHTKDCKTVYPFASTENRKVSLESLRKCIESIPTQDCFDSVEDLCKSCDGSGTVELDYTYDGKFYDIEAECPVCIGSGGSIVKSKEPNGKKEFLEDHYIGIGSAFFDPKRIKELVSIAEKLNVNEVTFLNEPQNNKPLFLSIGEAEVLLMCCHVYIDKSVVHPFNYLP